MFAELLRARLQGILDLTPAQLMRLEAHYELLLRWNRVLNLTALRDVEEIVERHYCESIFLAARLPSGPGSFADIGSGAGFPGAPVAIVRNDWHVTLIESHQRKAVFLRESTRDLANVTVVSKRVEAVSTHFDWAVSRAVRAEDVLGEMRRLAGTVALLSSDGACDRLSGSEDAPGWLRWSVYPMPWGEHRALCIGTSAHTP